MHTVLDDATTWFLQEIVYKDGLHIIVAEGFKSTEPEDLFIGQTNLGPAYSIDVRSDSREIVIRFAEFVVWQVIKESFTCRDDYESSDDDGFLRILERSRYLDYVIANHGWFREVVGPAKHYQLCTEYELVDIVAYDHPVIDEWPSS